MEHFGHGGTADIGALRGYTAGIEVTAGVLAVADVNVGDDVYDSSVGFFRKALIKATVTGFHVEDRDVKALGTYHAEAAVGIAQDQYGIWLDLYHELVALVYDVAHGGSKVVTYGIEVDFGVGELKVFEEDAIEVVVVVLAGVCQDYIEVFATLLITAARRMISGRVPTMMRSFKRPSFLKLIFVISVFILYFFFEHESLE